MRYCSDAIAIAQVASRIVNRGVIDDAAIVAAINFLDAAERELRHNKNHADVPPDGSDPCFGVEPVRKEK